MKKLVTFVLALSMLLSLAACGSKNDAEPTPAPGESVQPAPEATPAPAVATPKPEATPEPDDEADPTPETTPETTPPPATAAPVTTSAPTQEPGTASGAELTLQEIVDKLVEVSAFEGGPFYQSYEVSKDDAPFVIGYEDFSGDFTEALGYGPMMGSIAFVMVVFRLPDGADAQAFADDIKANADTRKWICVEAETVDAVVSGNTVMFIMADTAAVQGFISAFGQVMG